MRRGAATGPSGTPDRPGTATGGEPTFPVEIDVAGQVSAIRAYAGEFVLDAARRHGLVLPSLCRQGWCTRCAVRVESGVLDQTSSRRFYEEDRRAGFALICTGRACSPLRIVALRHEEFRAHRLAAGLPVPRG